VSTAPISSNRIRVNSAHLQPNPIELFLQRVRVLLLRTSIYCSIETADRSSDPTTCQPLKSHKNLILFNTVHLRSNPIELFLQRVASRSASQNKHLLLYRGRRIDRRIQPRVNRSNLIQSHPFQTLSSPIQSN
jgi:hypothetical protein